MGLSEIKKGGASELVEASSEVVTAGQDWAGVTYIDPDAVGANPTAKIYPDGSIVGSTDNGSYTKYPNGDLECSIYIGPTPTTSISGPIYISVGTSWLFPMRFFTIPRVITTTEGDTSNYASWGAIIAEGPSVSSVKLFAIGTTNSGSGFLAGNAKGRWKA